MLVYSSIAIYKSAEQEPSGVRRDAEHTKNNRNEMKLIHGCRRLAGEQCYLANERKLKTGW